MEDDILDAARSTLAIPETPIDPDSHEPHRAQADSPTAGSPEWIQQAYDTFGLRPWTWSASDRFCTITRRGRGELARIDIRTLLRNLPKPQRRGLSERWRALRMGLEDALEIDIRPGGDGRWWRIRARVVTRDAAGEPTRILGVTETVRSPAAGPNGCVRAHAFSASRDPMLVVDENWRILEINHAFVRLIGSHADSVLGQSLQRYLSASALEETPGKAVSHRDAPHQEGLFRTDETAGHQASSIPIELTLSDFMLTDTGDVHYIAALRDVTARKRAERELEHLASIDTLTQLPNRGTLQYRITRELEELARHETLSMLFVDLDGFKHVNDSLGHQAGDKLLQVVVKRLKAALRPRDVVARWGGDEFVVILEANATPDLAERIANRVLDTLSRPMIIAGHQISVTASIGVVHAPAAGRDTETLLKHADIAMYAAKDMGKNTVIVYHDGLQEMSMLSRLRAAIAGRALEFVVQPKFDGATRIVGAELLARWSTPDYGEVPPSVFVPLAEHNGMASALGELAIEHAARSAAELTKSGFPIPVAVNISALHVMDEDLAHVLSDACKRHAITADQIELEVTESIFLENTRAPEMRIEHLRNQGFRVAMDDFGAGYSSLGYLKRLPFDTIKIDRSFMSDLADDPRSRELLAGIVGLCTRLGMETVAEGVETVQQWELLQSLGIAQYQGFYLGRPMSMGHLIERLQA